MNVKAEDFNLEEGTVVVLGKVNRHRNCLADNGLVTKWFKEHNSLEITKGDAQTMLRRLKLKLVSPVMLIASVEVLVFTKLKVVYPPAKFKLLVIGRVLVWSSNTPKNLISTVL